MRLNGEERRLAWQNQGRARMALVARTGCSPLDAKTAVDEYLAGAKPAQELVDSRALRVAASTTTFHVAVSVDVDRFSDTVLRRRWLALFRRSGIATVDGIRQACAVARSKGLDVFPPCENVKPDGSCAGHEVQP